ncbi:MAG: glycosyltransferase family 39 protein [Planctomycetes bacterium]|nr:glycosyltransferase family 39 protein [Planctomycetota bacterium]
MSAEPAATRDVGERLARKLLLGICLVALVVRVVYVLGARASPLFDAPQMDALYHLEWARAFARGEDFQPGPFFRAPLYPWFLGLCLKTFGANLLVPRLVQALIGTLSVALVHRVGALVFDRRVGLLASAAAATYWMLVYFDGELLLPVLEVFFDLLAIERTLVAGRTGASRTWFAAGAAWGASALVRPNVLAFAPVLLLWSLRGTSPWRRRVARAAAFACGLALLVAPVSLYNRFGGGDSVLISSQGGVNFYIGNNPASDGSSAIVPGTRPDWWGGYHDAIAIAERARGGPLKPSAVSDFYTERALAWMRAEPTTALRHQLWKLRLFWSDVELGNNVDERFFALRYGPILRVLPLGFGVLAALGLAGLVLAARRAWSDAPLVLFVPVYTATVVAFFVCSRFRIPVLPPLMVFAAFACTWIWDAARSGRRAAAFACLAACAAVYAAVVSVPASVDRSHAQGWTLLGQVALARGDFGAAANCFEAARAEKPRLALAHEGLGLALAGLGREEEALGSLRTALELDPLLGPAAAEKALELHLRRGAFDSALEIARLEGRTRAWSAQGPFDEARVEHARFEALRTAGSAVEAGAALEHAAAALGRALERTLDGDLAFDVPFSTGRIAFERGDFDGAAAAFERALAARTAPDAEGWYHEALRGLAHALARAGRASTIRTRLEAHVDVSTADPRTAALVEELARLR